MPSDPAADQQAAAEAQHVGVDHPLQVRRAEAEGVLDRRQGHGDDEPVQHDQGVGHAEHGQGHPPVAACRGRLSPRHWRQPTVVLELVVNQLSRLMVLYAPRHADLAAEEVGMETRYAWEHEAPGHPRPAEVVRLEAFCNTVDRHTFGRHGDKPADRRELLSTAEALRDWLVGQRLLDDPGALVSAEDLDHARTLRDGLRAWLQARQRLDFDRPTLARARDQLARLRLRVGLDATTATLEPTGRSVTGALERLAADLATAAATGALERLKICSAPDCQFVYYDHSRSRTSRWCSTEVCGNRMKTRRYRHRQRG
jgi:predicted RNA-binding Zn ribbon-like protein